MPDTSLTIHAAIEHLIDGAQTPEEDQSEADLEPQLLPVRAALGSEPINEAAEGGSPEAPSSSLTGDLFNEAYAPLLAELAAIEPAAPPVVDAEAEQSEGGGASYRAYDQGELSHRLEVTGVLDPAGRAERSLGPLSNAETLGHGDEWTSPPGDEHSGSGQSIVPEPYKIVIVPDHIGAIPLQTRPASETGDDDLTYELVNLPDAFTGSITLGDGGAAISDGQVLSEAQYLSLHFDPAMGAAGTSAVVDVMVRNGSGETAGTTFGIEIRSAADGPFSESAGAGNDVIRGSFADDALAGGAGDDRLEGGSGDDILRGQAGDDIVHGHGGNDTLIGGAGADQLLGGSGDDLLIDDLAGFAVPDGSARLAGGDGLDRLELDGSGLVLDLNAIADARVTSIEQIDLGGNGNRLVLDISELMAISPDYDTLEVTGGAGDAVVASLLGAVVGAGPAGFTSYTVAGSTLLVEDAIDQSGIIV